MGNCLVTQLKGAVDNDSLLKLGEFTIDGTTVRLITTDGQPVVARIIEGDGVFPNGTKTSEVPGDYTEVKITGGVSKVAIKDDYRLSRILASPSLKVQLSELKYRTNLREIYLYDPAGQNHDLISGDLKDIANLQWLYAWFTNQYVTGDIKNIKLMYNEGGPESGMIDLRNCPKLYGNIVDIASPYLHKLNIWSCSNKIVGTLEALVAALRVDRPTGSIKFNMTSDTGVTFGGNHYTGDAAHASDGTDLVWTENTITWNGITVNA
jgi:hypothetical protein